MRITGTNFSFAMSDALNAALQRHRIFTHALGKRRIKNGVVLTAALDTVIEPYASFHHGRTFCSMGAFSYCVPAATLGLHVGRYCSIGPNTALIGMQHPLQRISTSNFTYEPAAANFRAALTEAGVTPFAIPVPVSPPPTIANDVWIGRDVLLRAGITIGDGAVIGARSIVTHDVPAYTIVAGAPARPIRNRFPDETVARLQLLRWWRFGVSQLAGIALDQPIDRYLDALEARIDGGLLPFEPAAPRLFDIVAEAEAAAACPDDALAAASPAAR